LSYDLLSIFGWPAEPFFVTPRWLKINVDDERNVEKTPGILPEIQTKKGAVAVRLDKDPARVFVRLGIPHQISNQDANFLLAEN
jgi:hypothetical protein